MILKFRGVPLHALRALFTTFESEPVGNSETAFFFVSFSFVPSRPTVSRFTLNQLESCVAQQLADKEKTKDAKKIAHERQRKKNENEKQKAKTSNALVTLPSARRHRRREKRQSDFLSNPAPTTVGVNRVRKWKITRLFSSLALLISRPAFYSS